MDAAVTFRPQSVSSPSGWSRSDSVAVRDAVPTEIAPDKAIAPLAPNGATADHAAEIESAAKAREIIVDTASREVIFRVVDTRSGDVVRQYPDEAMLKLRAYSRSLEQPADDVHALERQI